MFIQVFSTFFIFFYLINLIFFLLAPPPEGIPKHKKVSEITYSPDVPSDFPVFMHLSQKYGVLYIMSKFGHLFLYELSTGALLFRQAISSPQDSVFIGTRNSITDGILVISKSGSLISAVLDEKGYINHMVTQCSYAIPDVSSVALKLAARYSLPGCDNLFVDLFNNMLISGNYQGAAKIASQAPGTLLRNPDTINKFKNLQSQPGQPQPILIYFQTLLEKGKLNGNSPIKIEQNFFFFCNFALNSFYLSKSLRINRTRQASPR